MRYGARRRQIALHCFAVQRTVNDNTILYNSRPGTASKTTPVRTGPVHCCRSILTPPTRTLTKPSITRPSSPNLNQEVASVCASLNKAIFRKLLCPRPVTYLMEYAFTFCFASLKFLPISVSCINHESIIIGLVTLTFDLLTSK